MRKKGTHKYKVKYRVAKEEIPASREVAELAGCACGHAFHPSRVCGDTRGVDSICLCCAAPHSPDWPCGICGKRLNAEQDPTCSVGMKGCFVVGEHAHEWDPKSKGGAHRVTMPTERPASDVPGMLVKLLRSVGALELRIGSVLRPPSETRPAPTPTRSSIARDVAVVIAHVESVTERVDL